MAAVLPAPNPDKSNEQTAPPEGIVELLLGYKTEGETARKSGPDSRDEVWDANVDLYWGRFDFSNKADWQAREVMPEAPVFVDRWAAAMSEALTSSSEWFTVDIPGDTEGDLVFGIKKFMDAHLGRCGRNQLGQVMGFPAVFEEQMKLGALMAACCTVTWKQGANGKGFVAVEAFDPRSLWLDPKGRGLYRFRRTEIDLHDLIKLAKMKDEQGKSLYNLQEINSLVSEISQEMEKALQASTGHGQAVTSIRKPVVLHEFLATVIDVEGKILGENQLCILANESKLIRGPEQNPFWHKKDWVLYTPLITVPLAPYGKSYMENWSGVARAFTNMTNLILDGTRAAALNAFVVDISKLENPQQMADGISPNKVFVLDENASIEDFWGKMELGRMPPEVITVWQALKKEMQEGANQSELALGQFPTKSRITAKEIEGAERGGSALVASMARTVEGRHLEPQLDLIWKTALQHMDPNDRELAAIVGEDIYSMLFARRRELASSNITFPVKGISTVIERGQKLQKLIMMLGVIGQSEIMTVEFFKNIPAGALIDELFKLAGIDINILKPSPREQQLRDITEPVQPQLQETPPQPQGS